MASHPCDLAPELRAGAVGGLLELAGTSGAFDDLLCDWLSYIGRCLPSPNWPGIRSQPRLTTVCSPTNRSCVALPKWLSPYIAVFQESFARRTSKRVWTYFYEYVHTMSIVMSPCGATSLALYPSVPKTQQNFTLECCVVDSSLGILLMKLMSAKPSK
jgi:hypothetical protein